MGICPKPRFAKPTSAFVGSRPAAKEKIWIMPWRTPKAFWLHLEEYFGSPYPYEKLDIIAAPDYAFGAMENPGRDRLPGILAAIGR